MKKICLWIILVMCCASAAHAEVWSVRSMDPAGVTQESRWEIRRDGERVEYFLQGQEAPVYTLFMTPEDSRVELAGGMIRRFSSGFLLLTDLPMPVFISGEDASEGARRCFQEYVGGTGFQNCVNVTWAASLNEALSLPAPQSGEAVLVGQNGRITVIIGPDFQAERVE